MATHTPHTVRQLQRTLYAKAKGCPLGGLAARPGQPRGPWRRGAIDGGDRRRWTRRGEAQQRARATPHRALPMPTGATGRYPAAHRGDTPPRECPGRSAGGADGDAPGPCTDLCSRFPPVCVRGPTAERGQNGRTGHPGRPLGAGLGRRGKGFAQLLSDHAPRPAAASQQTTRGRWASAARAEAAPPGPRRVSGAGRAHHRGRPPGAPLSPVYSPISLTLLAQGWPQRGSPEPWGATRHR